MLLCAMPDKTALLGRCVTQASPEKMNSRRFIAGINLCGSGGWQVSSAICKLQTPKPKGMVQSESKVQEPGQSMV